jgi:glycosyltransferase involved in cell wall biosynthesis
MLDYQWIISQIGAREHYSVARGLHARGQLHTLYTDAWCRHGRQWLARGPAFCRALAGRCHRDVPDNRVVAFTLPALADEEFVRIGREFATRVARHLEPLPLDAGRHCHFGYNTGCLETQQALRQRGVTTIVGQIDPAVVEEDIVLAEVARWPGWQDIPGRIPACHRDRVRQEWATADLVLVNSPWSHQALARQGVPEAKLIIVPLAYEPASGGTVRTPPPVPAPLTVLWLGQVNLRKGIQYLLAAARLLERAPVRFLVAGPVLITPQGVAQAPPNVQFLGRITRDQTDALYDQADVFVLPTLSDGFAITQLEAMARGLPVITTPNCGRVVTDGRDGLIVPAGDAEALAAAMARLEADRPLLAEMSRQALLTVKRFSLANQAEQLNRAVAACRRGLAGPEIQKEIDAVGDVAGAGA